MIYDCFCFFDEVDILEIRLNELDKVIDTFIIIEADETYTGIKRESSFVRHEARFAHFAKKIRHHFISFPPHITAQKPLQWQPWARENYQRNYIAQALKEANANDSDTILISDVDEIPKSESIIAYKDYKGIKALDMDMYYFFLNNLSQYHRWKKGSQMLFYADFTSILDDEVFRFDMTCQEDINKGTTPTKLRIYDGKKKRHFYPCGWHFSYMGGEQAVIKKLDSFAHQEWRNAINQPIDSNDMRFGSRDSHIESSTLDSSAQSGGGGIF